MPAQRSDILPLLVLAAAAAAILPSRAEAGPGGGSRGRPRAAQSFVTKGGLDFIQLTGGRLSGGDLAGQRVAPFSLCKTAVTVGAYAACVNAEVCTLPLTGGNCNWRTDRPDHPVNCVDFGQASRFCAWLGGRLPTAAEREWAATGGERRDYPWGKALPGARACWNGEDNDREAKGWRGTCPVAAHPAGASKQGLLDLAGNVWEWTSSDYGSGKEVRGGSWEDGYPDLLLAGRRDKRDPSTWGGTLGFRCVL